MEESEMKSRGSSGLNLRQKIQYFIANGGKGIISGLINSAFIKYYTDYVGLDPKWMGYIYVIFTIWAAINDPIFGLWSDKRPFIKGKGKYRPIFIKVLPLWIIVILAFPWASPNWSQFAISVYFFFALTLYETGSTLISITYGAIATNLFITTEERVEVELVDNYLGVLSIFGNAIPIMILSMDVNTNVLLIFFGIVTIASGLIMAVCIPVLREKEEFYLNDSTQPFSLTDIFKEALILLKDKAFALYFISFLLLQRVASKYILGLTYFYENLILTEGFWTGAPDLAIGAMGLVLFPFIAKWIKKHGSKKVVLRMMFVSMIGYIILTFVPITQGEELRMTTVLGISIPGDASYWIGTFVYFIIYFGLCGVYTANGPIKRRLIDYLEVKTGERRPGLTGGVLGVLMTPGDALYVFLFTQILSAFNYDGRSTIQVPTAQLGLRIAIGIMPAVLILIGLYTLSKYPIDKKMEAEIEAKMIAKYYTEPEDMQEVEKIDNEER